MLSHAPTHTAHHPGQLPERQTQLAQQGVSVQIAEAFVFVRLNPPEAVFIREFIENAAHPRQRVG